MSLVVRVWDLPTRLFHWTLVALVVGLVSTAQLGGEAMQWHMRLGYAVATLLLWRLIWGVVGGYWSRFSNFVRGPAHILSYVRTGGSALDHVGHNPLGALSVLAMLFALGLQIASGLFSDDEIAAAGPLVAHAAPHWVEWATAYHRGLGKPLLLVLIALHLLAIAAYRVLRHENLLAAMLSGDKTLSAPAPASRDDQRQRLLALALLGLATALIVWALRRWG